MNTILRVYNQNNEIFDLDLAQDQDFLLDISAKEAGVIPSIFGISSQNIALPGTNKNNDYFGNLWNLHTVPGTKFTRSYPCQVLENGDEVFTGKIYLQSVVTDQRGDTFYNVVVVDEVVDLKTQIQDLTWREVFAFYSGSAAVPVPQVNAGWNHDYTYDNISGSWHLELPQIGTGTPPVNNFGLPEEGDIVYPLAEYGSEENTTLTAVANGPYKGTFTNSSSPLSVSQFKPSIRLNAMWKALMRFTGYEYESEFIDSDYFKTIYYLTTADENPGAKTDSERVVFSAYKGNNQDFASPTDTQQVTFNTETYDDADAWDISTSEYTAQGQGEHSFQFRIDWELLNSVTPTTLRRAEFELLVNGSPITPRIDWSMPARPTTGAFTGNWSKVYLSQGDVVTLRLSTLLVVGETLRLSAGTNSYFQCYESPANAPGSLVDMSLNFSEDDTVENWLAGMIQKFNLVITPKKDNERTLLVEPFDTWKTKGEVKDWTDLVDRDVKFQIEHPLQNRAQNVILSDEEDEDSANQYSIQKLGKVYGEIEYKSDSNIIEGEERIGTYFAPTPMKYIEGTNTFIVPQIHTEENGEKRAFKFKPRLLHYVNSNGIFATPEPVEGLIGLDGITVTLNTYFVRDENGTTQDVTTYPVFHHINELPADNDWDSDTNPSTTKDLHFGNRGHWSYHQDYVNAQTYRDALYEYWITYLNEIYDEDARLLTCNVVLNPVTVNQLELNDRIFIDGAYYRINKIDGVSLTEERSTEVQLIKEATRASQYPRRRVVKVIGGGGTGGSTGGGQGGGLKGNDYTEDIVIGSENSSGKVLYENYNTGDTVNDYDLIVQAASKDNIIANPSGSYWQTVPTSVPSSTISIGKNYIDVRSPNNVVVGYNNEISGETSTGMIIGQNNNLAMTDAGTNVLIGSDVTSSFVSSSVTDNFIVSLNSDAQKDLSDVSGSVLLNPIKPVSGSQYSDKAVAGNFISQGTASFEDSVIITGSLTVNGTEVVPVDTGSFESKTRFNHLFGTDPTAVTFATVSNMTGDNRGVKLDYVLFSGSATNVGQLQVTGDGVSITSVDKVVERNITGAPTSSFTAAYNASDVEVKATFIGSDYTISGSIITMI